MKVMLRAFGHLQGLHEVPDNHVPRDIYLIHRTNEYKYFEEEYTFPTTPSLCKAVFVYSGHGVKKGNKSYLVYDFRRLE